jgi:hypothetical protein
LIEALCQEPSNLMAFMIALKMLDGMIEYWLGRTDKVKAGSILELILNAIRALIKTITTRSRK